MVDPATAVLALFALTQAVYCILNVATIAFLHLRPDNPVATTADDEADRVLRVLLPVHRERRDVVADTLDHLYDTDYPSELLYVYLVYEPDDDLTTTYVDDLVSDARQAGRDVTAVAVDKPMLAAHLSEGPNLRPSTRLPKTKAAALTYAFVTLSFSPDDVVTVFDADTRVPRDLPRLAVAGLDEYDIVQAKQTVRNRTDGWLPRLEAMGIAAWSDVVYGRTGGGPYQLLGKAYFTTARVLDDLGQWDADAVTEDMSLGVAASVRGYRLGVLDRYVQDLCPSDPRAWLRQKRRWVRGPYAHLRQPDFGVLERLRFATFTVVNQVMAVLNVVGVPVGLVVLGWALLRPGPTFGPVLSAVVAFNLGNWVYYSYRAYAASAAAIEFRSRREMAGYFLLSNPLTQLVYSTLWAAPVALAVLDVLRGERATFEVTPK